MRKIKVIFIIVLAFLASVRDANAQNDKLLDGLLAKLSTSCVELSYTYSTKLSGLKVAGNHSLELQADLWHLKGDGLEIFCDSKTVWTLDYAEKEVIIENAVQGETGEFTNPAQILSGLKKNFYLKEKRRTSDSKAVIYMMIPNTNMDINITYFNMEIKESDSMLRKASFCLEGAEAVDLNIHSMIMTTKKPVSYYRPSQIFDSSWIITDMR